MDALNRENCPKHHSAANQLPEGSKSFRTTRNSAEKLLKKSVLLKSLVCLSGSTSVA
jgi:hypothetical protein